jgi:hypothetical protein
MEARVGPVARKSVPPGLSFSLGDSDVRAPEFQKADVQGISCLLSAWNALGEAVRLSGYFAVEKGFGELLVGKPERESAAFYMGRIGVVCLNLLSELKIERPKAKAVGAAPAWAPEVRIEVRNKPEPGVAAAPEKKPDTSKPASQSAQETLKPKSESEEGGGEVARTD